MSWHRRKLAVLAAVAAVLTGIVAAAPPAPPTIAVVRVATEISAGSVVSTDQVLIEEVTEDALPRGALTDPSLVVGTTAITRLPVGQVITLDAVLSPRSVATGQVIAPLRLSDTAVVGLLQPGSTVDVLAADAETPTAATIARAVRVVAVPRAEEATGIARDSSGSSGALVLVEVDPTTAAALAQAAVSMQLSVVLR